MSKKHKHKPNYKSRLKTLFDHPTVKHTASIGLGVLSVTLGLVSDGSYTISKKLKDLKKEVDSH